MWDRRNLSSALHSFRPHNKPIMRVEWAPYKKGMLPYTSSSIAEHCTHGLLPNSKLLSPMLCFCLGLQHLLCA